MFTEIEIICSPHFLCDISPSLENWLNLQFVPKHKRNEDQKSERDPPTAEMCHNKLKVQIFVWIGRIC